MTQLVEGSYFETTKMKSISFDEMTEKYLIVAIREWEWLRDNPVSRLSFSVGNKNARDRWLSDEEEKDLMKAATNPWWLRNFLIVALHTGMRKGEILNLKWKNVDFKRKTVAVVKSKNDEKRI